MRLLLGQIERKGLTPVVSCLLIFIQLVGGVPTPTPSESPTTSGSRSGTEVASSADVLGGSGEDVTTTQVPSNVSEVEITSANLIPIPVIKVNFSETEYENPDSEVAKTVTIRTRSGKALGVPSDFTKRFSSSEAPAQLNLDAGPAEDPEARSDSESDKDVQLILNDDEPPAEENKNSSKVVVGENETKTRPDAEAKPLEFDDPRWEFDDADRNAPKAPKPTEKSPEDRLVQKIFGGECTMKIWNRCNKITFWGGDYLVPDKNNPGKMIVKHHKIRCSESPGHTICLRNGWTVARCHMLCMAQCNVEFKLEYEKLVSHEGDCRMPLLEK